MKRSIIITVFCACVAFLFWQCNKESVVEKVEYQRGNIVHYGSGAPSSTIGEIGDYYFDLSVSDLYGAKTESGWGDPVSLKGDRGERGEQGEQGEKGEKGETGDKGEKGDKGAQGDKGLTGDKGEQGDKGEHGEKGVKGDKGYQGDRGEKGATGEQGEQAGTKGQKGADGAPATRIHLGQGAPDSNIGNIGDWYVDSQNKRIYGPKKYNGWREYIDEYEHSIINSSDYTLNEDKTELIRWNNLRTTFIDMNIISDFKNVKIIKAGAFQNCKNLVNIKISDKVTTLEDPYYRNYYDHKEGVFDSCISLKSVTIPNSVTGIGSYAFRGCTSLKSVTIGNGVTSIGNYYCPINFEIEL